MIHFTDRVELDAARTGAVIALLPSSTFAVRQLREVGGTVDTDYIDQTVAIANRD